MISTPSTRSLVIDLRIITLTVPPQEVITRNNVTIKVTAVLYFFVVNPITAVVKVVSFHQATSQLGQTTLRNVVGQSELDELLAQRNKINHDLQVIIDEQTERWGVKVLTVEVKDIELPATCSVRWQTPSFVPACSFLIPLITQYYQEELTVSENNDVWNPEYVFCIKKGQRPTMNLCPEYFQQIGSTDTCTTCQDARIMVQPGLVRKPPLQEHQKTTRLMDVGKQAIKRIYQRFVPDEMRRRYANTLRQGFRHQKKAVIRRDM
jgi:SPFH domain / Band 7 family